MGVVTRTDPRPRLTDAVNRRAFAVAIRDTNGASERVHPVDHQVAFSDSLLTGKGGCFGETTKPAIPAERDPAVAKAGDDFVPLAHRPIHLGEQPLRSFLRPMPRHLPDPG